MPVFLCTSCVENRDPVTLYIPNDLLPDRLREDCPVCGGPLVREGDPAEDFRIDGDRRLE